MAELRVDLTEAAQNVRGSEPWMVEDRSHFEKAKLDVLYALLPLCLGRLGKGDSGHKESLQCPTVPVPSQKSGFMAQIAMELVNDDMLRADRIVKHPHALTQFGKQFRLVVDPWTVAGEHRQRAAYFRRMIVAAPRIACSRPRGIRLRDPLPGLFQQMCGPVRRLAYSPRYLLAISETPALEVRCSFKPEQDDSIIGE
jgi:hypothetical protein